ncbi:hypothetical protein [Natranaerobius thermophilus]|uniref:FlgN family protein n=1 Tax=Natranaerobius thermophilus (strain ATCC BAA-1301 / DSM 18059 / JW/NM-WN-LF) TaxID=457570 RepID=B2A821_NATTJ|nr:hypothetical protein [Natranaerobius thermophilus]ACB85793.1 hypothetical protein Nther_2227 [Natranaerobius thermophilus JW/NM-WN-LF]
MEKLNEWKQYLEQHRKLTKRFLHLTERQENLLNKEKIDECLNLFDKKKQVMDEITELQKTIAGYKEQYAHLVEEPLLSEIRELQSSSQENMETAMNKIENLEQEFNKRKLNIGEELKRVKQDKQTVNTYFSSKNKSKGEGVFFDKKS